MNNNNKNDQRTENGVCLFLSQVKTWNRLKLSTYIQNLDISQMILFYIKLFSSFSQITASYTDSPMMEILVYPVLAIGYVFFLIIYQILYIFLLW